MGRRTKLTQYVVVLGHRTLALEDLDEHRGLVVLVGGERLRLLGWDNGVTADDLRHHSTHSLDTLLSAKEKKRSAQKRERGTGVISKTAKHVLARFIPVET